ncbi:hypothetical protein M2360_005311 [Rhizobium sp. SG_E_25_P2]|jgi:Protein of unknown function (DUF982)|uniref:DUF982 domain-containing protein n=1 Tax=Rhizobium sp. SG_E_25_P2 TaxID=2879942 RepID=UPI002473E7A7|nr:DUF982 domain-containing protein [Rhizobium sp. SG_E_25_P2]MDH6269879.1 hypothetical protein [Rhizobium sp. SG_E_25_P2]
MINGLWKMGVVLHDRRSGKEVAKIRTTREAGEFLLDKWSGERCASYQKAVVSCVSAMRGESLHESAATAFISAVIQANYGFNFFEAYWDVFDLEISRAADAVFQEDYTFWTAQQKQGPSLAANASH